MVQTSSVCECLEGEMNLMAYVRLKQESWWAFDWKKKILGRVLAGGRKLGIKSPVKYPYPILALFRLRQSIP